MKYSTSCVYNKRLLVVVGVFRVALLELKELLCKLKLLLLILANKCMSVGDGNLICFMLRYCSNIFEI